MNVNFVPFTPKIGPTADADSMLTNEVIGIILGQFKIAPPDELQQVGFRGVQPGTLRWPWHAKAPGTSHVRSTASGRRRLIFTTARCRAWMRCSAGGGATDVV